MDDYPVFNDMSDFLCSCISNIQSIVASNRSHIPKLCTLCCSGVKDLIFFDRDLGIPLEEVCVIQNPIFKNLPRDLGKAFPDLEDPRTRLQKYTEYIPALPTPESICPAPITILSFDYMGGFDIDLSQLFEMFNWSQKRAESIIIMISKESGNLGLLEMDAAEDKVKEKICTKSIEFKRFKIKEGEKIGLWGRF